MNIIELIKSLPDYIGSNGRSNSDISCAEKQLSTHFSQEYTQYLQQIGLVAFDGRELTGLCKDQRLNVVNVTIEERSRNQSVPATWYVIEQANMDGIVIWQSPKGEIYQTSPNSSYKKICNSLSDYLSATT